MSAVGRDEIIDAVVEDLRARSLLGIEQYGIPIGEAAGTPMTWAREAYAEALDLAIYLRRMIAELNKASKPSHTV